LPGQWNERFGYRPLLAESFTDPEAYAGTCYKASNWEAGGKSAGHSRHRAGFYVPNERPKKLWLKSLGPQGREQLSGLEVPADCQAGLLAIWLIFLPWVLFRPMTTRSVPWDSSC
jgi:hypothetical protein